MSVPKPLPTPVFLEGHATHTQDGWAVRVLGPWPFTVEVAHLGDLDAEASKRLQVRRADADVKVHVVISVYRQA